jgi:hypothetical protein
MSDDFYLSAAQKRALQLDAEANQITTGLMQARANDDEYTARDLIQGLANVQAERRNLDMAVREYVQASNPPSPPQLTAEEVKAKPIERMTHEERMKMFESPRHGPVDANKYWEGVEHVRRNPYNPGGGR